MEKAEKFIIEHTRNCSNLLYRDYIGGFDKTVYQSWLTPDHARRVAEIAREETIKEVCELLKNNIAEYVLPNKGLDLDWFIEDLKKNLEDKV